MTCNPTKTAAAAIGTWLLATMAMAQQGPVLFGPDSQPVPNSPAPRTAAPPSRRVQAPEHRRNDRPVPQSDRVADGVSRQPSRQSRTVQPRTPQSANSQAERYRQWQQQRAMQQRNSQVQAAQQRAAQQRAMQQRAAQQRGQSTQQVPRSSSRSSSRYRQPAQYRPTPRSSGPSNVARGWNNPGQSQRAAQRSSAYPPLYRGNAGGTGNTATAQRGPTNRVSPQRSTRSRTSYSAGRVPTVKQGTPTRGSWNSRGAASGRTSRAAVPQRSPSRAGQIFGSRETQRRR